MLHILVHIVVHNIHILVNGLLANKDIFSEVLVHKMNDCSGYIDIVLIAITVQLKCYPVYFVCIEVK